jgi:hypothetical protein
MPSPALKIPFIPFPLFGTSCPQHRSRALKLSVHRIQRLTAGGRTGRPRRLSHGTSGQIQRRRLRQHELVGQEIGGLPEAVVLRLLADEPDPGVNRQFPIHLPVVLDIGLGVVRDVAALHEPRELRLR